MLHFFQENFHLEVLISLLFYCLGAFPFFIIFWVLGKQRWKKLRIQETVRTNFHHFKHDLGYSICTIILFAIVDTTLFYLESQGYTLIYFDVNKCGWSWMIISFCIALIIDDTTFYWSHRLIHSPLLYRSFHKVHHKSTDPSPLTAFAFHPSEALIDKSIHFILPFFLPLNFGTLIAWQLFSMINNIFAHLGYEIYPKNWIKFPFLKFKTTSTHHNMHHELFNGNYALYFTWWDKWMGTEFKDYEIRNQKIFERKNLTKDK